MKFCQRFNIFFVLAECSNCNIEGIQPKGPYPAYAWQIGYFWQDTLDIFPVSEGVMGAVEAQETVRFNEGMLLAREVLHFPIRSRRTLK